MSNVAMELVNVKKSIGKKEIIKGLSFSIQKGEVFGFIGPNGAGKTTTIRMMVGLMKLTDGDVKILGNSIKSNYKEAVREVGAIVENPEMYPFMSGWQNLMHYSRMIPGISKGRVKEVISLVGLEKVIKEKVGRYSLGMRQRLGIAQALLHNPSILILDEPTNGLDPAGIREIREYIRKIAKEQQVAVIISSHLLAEIEQVCDRIGIIKNGEMISIQSVKDQEELEQESLSQVQLEVTPINHAMNLLKEKYEIDAEVNDQSISFEYNKADIPKLIQFLVSEEIDIYQVEISKVTLEDKFFDLIGENVIG
ncbi:ATP-binding cassette domain-containing protein [Ornithinibacillus sp. L9]|uniref:ATP-binding cassette domain-containing protein n=1 Tax=Ornithinibacillus caprae TaxID=2678566 RepID=A0A6N8FQB1_9BACI|nr:ABC transporter ATP-binding protein [Ornithinibacillus caprae]MUK89748.1 ATP-binding cassette domain-containing protein [Ornithinibacillus caprae]